MKWMFRHGHECTVFAPVYFCLAFINLRLKLFFTKNWFNGTLEEQHNLLTAFDFTNNEQSRLLQFTIPDVLHRIFGMTIEHAYILQRFTFIFLAFTLFHLYLRKWFSALESFGGVAFLSAIMPLAYFNHLQESAPLLLLTFLLGLWAIREKAHIAFAIILFIGTINNETMLILPLAYFASHFRQWNVGTGLRAGLQTLAVSAPAICVLLVIRYLTRENAHLGHWFLLPENLERMGRDFLLSPFEFHTAFYLYIFFLYGAFWVYPFLHWKHQDDFLRRASIIIPPFIIIHFLTGVIAEVRQMLPLAYLLVPMGLMELRRLKGSSHPEQPLEYYC